MNRTNDSIKNNNAKSPSLVESGLLFSIVALLLITLGSYFQSRNFNSGILITEFIIILAPSLLLLIIRKYKLKEVLSLNRVSFLNILLFFNDCNFYVDCCNY